MRAISRSDDSSSRVAAIATIAILICALGCSARQRIVERDDVSITNDVRTRLAADAQARPLGINVDTNAGVVRLTGSVPTDSDRSSVERIARETPGVRAVDNSVRFGSAAVEQPVTR